jgi:hypothetical protein
MPDGKKMDSLAARFSLTAVAPSVTFIVISGVAFVNAVVLAALSPKNVWVLVGVVVVVVAVRLGSWWADIRVLRRNRELLNTLRAQQAAHRDWHAMYVITAAQLSSLPVADDLATQRQTVADSRAHRDGWITDDWMRAIDNTVWSMLARLRDTVEVRRTVAEAEAYSAIRPELAASVAARRTQIDAVDRAATDLVKTLRSLVDTVAAVDAAIADSERRRADDEHADALLSRLAGHDPQTTPAVHTISRAELPDGAASGDLRLLTAGLTAVQAHLTGKR